MLAWQRWSIILVALGLTLSACEPPAADAGAEDAVTDGEMAIADPAVVEQTIGELETQFAEFAAAGEADSLAAMYAEDAVVMPPNAEMVEGRQAVRGMFGQVLGAPGASLTIESEEVNVAPGGGMAYTLGNWEYSTDTVQDHGDYLVVYERRNGEWVITADIWNSNIPLEQIMQGMSGSGGQA